MASAFISVTTTANLCSVKPNIAKPEVNEGSGTLTEFYEGCTYANSPHKGRDLQCDRGEPPITPSPLQGLHLFLWPAWCDYALATKSAKTQMPRGPLALAF